MYARGNMLLSNFGHCTVDVKMNLFMTYYSSLSAVLCSQSMIIPLLLRVFMLHIMTFLDSCFIYLRMLPFRAAYQAFQCLGGNYFIVCTSEF